ncbi:MAG: chemotaxis protein CheW [Thiomonas sp.]|nr:chemotaxis protein CheW [Thiomonas sp.]
MNAAPSWLQFRLGGQTHALEAAAVRQIMRAPQLTPLPLLGAHSHSPGLMAWQGRPLLVLDLGACLLHRPSVAGDDARFLVWTQAQQAGVLAVDGVGPLLRLSATTLTRHWAPAQPGLPPPWSAIRGLLHAGDSADTEAPDLGRALSEPIAVFDVAALWQACWNRLHHQASGEDER